MSGSSLDNDNSKKTWTKRKILTRIILILVCCLVVITLAVIAYCGVNVYKDNKQAEKTLTVYIKDDVSDSDVKQLEEEIKSIDNIENVEFVPKEQAWAEQLETLDEGQADFFTQMNSEFPLPDAYDVIVSDVSKYNSVYLKLEKLDNVETISTSRKKSTFSDNMKKFKKELNKVLSGNSDAIPEETSQAGTNGGAE